MNSPVGIARQPKIWNLPNQLTLARIVLSVVFFIILALENHGKTYGTLPQNKINFVLNASVILFILAGITDFLDGYLARKMGLVSTFGRIADPFADKIMICGGFVMLTGVTPRMVEPWFAVVVLFREFLVSGLRSFIESRGIAFGAVLSGKLKMAAQTVSIPLVLFYQANLAWVPLDSSIHWFAVSFYWFTWAFLALTLVLTVYSAVGYVIRAIHLIRENARLQ
jgi:CDP-diacylglycerol--glycerol-3-phosphate 3-phosphatidyltransferase